MDAVVCYESEYGNTHVVAEAIARGLRRTMEARALPIDHATEPALAHSRLLVIGGPTHVHGLSTARSRRAAVDRAHRDDAPIALDPDADSGGIRAWFDAMPSSTALAAAFDTRMQGPAILTGRASKAISKRLRDHGFDEIVEPESFLVSHENHLLPGEEERAEQWGEHLAVLVQATTDGE